MSIKSRPPKIMLTYLFTLFTTIELSAPPVSASASPSAFIDKPDSHTKDKWLLLLLSGFITVPHLFNPPVVTLYPVSNDPTPPPEQGATASSLSMPSPMPSPMPSDSTSEWHPINDLSLNLETINQAMADREQARLLEEASSRESDDEQSLEAESYITTAISDYVLMQTTYSLMPLIMNPPSWSEVFYALQDFYQTSSRQVRVRRSLDDRLHEVLTQGRMFLTQIPTKETIEGVYQIIRYFQAALKEHSPGRPLVISGLAVGNAIIERAIVERFRRENGNHSFSVTGHFIQLEEGVFIHCSDNYQKDKPNLLDIYTSTPMLPFVELDYRQAVDSISSTMPEAFILPLVSWIPESENEWFSNLSQNPSVAGFIHLQARFACGSQTLWPPVPLHGSISGRYFDMRNFNLLGWGSNDALQDDFQNEIRLRTTLEVHFPDSFSAPELPPELLYTDEFRKANFKKVELSPPPDDSDSDDD